jgi:hypothetical protein
MVVQLEIMHAQSTLAVAVGRNGTRVLDDVASILLMRLEATDGASGKFKTGVIFVSQPVHVTHDVRCWIDCGLALAINLSALRLSRYRPSTPNPPPP